MCDNCLLMRELDGSIGERAEELRLLRYAGVYLACGDVARRRDWPPEATATEAKGLA